MLLEDGANLQAPVIDQTAEAKSDTVAAPSTEAKPDSTDIDLSVLGEDYTGFKVSKNDLAELKKAYATEGFPDAMKALLADPLLTKAYAKSYDDFNRGVQDKYTKIATEKKSLETSRSELEKLKQEYLGKMDEAEKVLGDEMYRLKPSVRKELDALQEELQNQEISQNRYEKTVVDILKRAKSEHLAAKKAENDAMAQKIESIRKSASAKLEPLGIKSEYADFIISGMVLNGINPEIAGDEAKEFFESHKKASFDAGYRAGITAKSEKPTTTPTNTENAPTNTTAEVKTELIPPPGMRGGLFGINFGGIKKG